MSQTDTPARSRVNVRRPDVMERVQAEVTRHYSSPMVRGIREAGGEWKTGATTIVLARDFGFCYGVERAIDLAYAARRVFPENRMFLIGEIIHNPEVNRQLEAMGIESLPWRAMNEQYESLGEEDVVLVPAFGAPTSFMDKIKERGCSVVDTTCGDVMKVWRRVRQYAKENVTAIIHGKAAHEETRATASRALGDAGSGHFLVVLNPEEADRVCHYIRNGGDSAAFLASFSEDAYSVGFNPDIHLIRLGVANQTTMLKSETEAIQNALRKAVSDRDGMEESFQVFDTICGATQERQDALFLLLNRKLDALIVVGGYNSSNTTHLVEIGRETTPTYFIRNAECLKNLEMIVHYDIDQKREIDTEANFLRAGPVTVGITAGASCPDNLIEATIRRILHLRGEVDELPVSL